MARTDDSSCACRDRCGDVPEDRDAPLAVCKGLPPVRTVWLPPVRLSYEPRPFVPNTEESKP